MPLSDDERAAFDALASKAEGYAPEGYTPEGFVHQSTLGARLAKQKEGLTAAQQATAAELTAEREQREALEAELKSYRDKGKSEDELLAAQLAGKDTEIEAWKKKAAEDRALADTHLANSQRMWQRNELIRMISESGVSPARMATALREAEAEIDMAVAGDPGAFALEMKDADGLPVDQPQEAFTGWWKEQKHLHGSRGSGIPAPGAGRPPGDPPPPDPTAGMTEAQAWTYNANKYGSA